MMMMDPLPKNAWLNDLKIVENRLGFGAYVYRLYDDEGTLLYIGSAKDPRRRLAEHYDQWPQKPWIFHVALVQMSKRYTTRQLAYDAEWIAIKAEHPVFNISGVPEHERLARSWVPNRMI